MLRLRPDLAGDRALARHRERRASRGDGAVAGAHDRGRPYDDRRVAETRLTGVRAIGGAR